MIPELDNFTYPLYTCIDCTVREISIGKWLREFEKIEKKQKINSKKENRKTEDEVKVQTFVGEHLIG